MFENPLKKFGAGKNYKKFCYVKNNFQMISKAKKKLEKLWENIYRINRRWNGF
jgi:hypothetical protein